MIVNTPCCPICIRSYSSLIIPKIIAPCGHGICSECLINFKDHEEEKNGSLHDLKCPQCRGIIVQDFENYDLQHITNNVDLSTVPYWSKRLLEAIDTKGEVVEITPELSPFCRTLFTRIVYSEDLKAMGTIKTENWTACDSQKVENIVKAFIMGLINSNIDANEALDWITVLNVPQRVEIKLLHEVNKFYTTKEFLHRMKADFLLDTLFE